VSQMMRSTSTMATTNKDPQEKIFQLLMNIGIVMRNQLHMLESLRTQTINGGARISWSHPYTSETNRQMVLYAKGQIWALAPDAKRALPDLSRNRKRSMGQLRDSVDQRRGIYKAIQEFLIKKGDECAINEAKGDEDCQGYTSWFTPAIQAILLENNITQEELVAAGFSSPELDQVIAEARRIDIHGGPVHPTEVQKRLGLISPEKFIKVSQEERLGEGTSSSSASHPLSEPSV